VEDLEAQRQAYISSRSTSADGDCRRRAKLPIRCAGRSRAYLAEFRIVIGENIVFRENIVELNATTSLMDAPVSETGQNVAAERTTRAASAPTQKVAYILTRFPKLTETFVLYEILALEGQGVDVEIFPLLSAENAATNQGASLFQKILELVKKPGKRAVMHADAAALVERAHYHPLLSWSVISAVLSILFHSPRACLGALGTLVRANWGSWNFLRPRPLSKMRWTREMQRAGVTHIHAHFANHPAAAAFLVHRLTGIPYSFTAHGSDLHMDRHMPKVREAARHHHLPLQPRSDSRECGREHADKVEVIHCGVDTSVRVPTHRAAPNRVRSMLCIGTMHEVKGQTYLLEACRLLTGGGINVVCHLVGKGPDWDMLTTQVRESGMEKRVVFHGLLTRVQVAELAGRCDVLVAPSVPTECGRREGIPVVLMEAMASELPVVASRISGIPELVDDGLNGYLVAPRDAAGLADALGRLHAEPLIRRQFGIEGRRKVVREFDVHRNAAALAERFRARQPPA
jgi:glycosyltransferase involved in cell wall biosynthesis